jgi:hypothetical protein
MDAHQVQRVEPGDKVTQLEATMAELEQEHRAQESDLLAQVSDLWSRVLAYEERIDGLISANAALSEARDDSTRRQLDDSLQHQSTLTT